MTKQIVAGTLRIGGGAPVSVQSMTNTPTWDVKRTSAQIRALADAGCDLVRVTVNDAPSAAAVRALVDASPVPLCADVHFDHALGIAALEGGIAKLRINPGNIGGETHVRAVADCARAHGAPIRIGVNSGSVEKDIIQRDGGVTARGMVDSALSHARMLERAGFDNIVLSLKASSVRTTVEAYRLASRACAYPLHLGVTEAGLPGSGTVKSAIGIGALLLDGIGDTIRVSLTGDPIEEPKAALQILRALGLRGGMNYVSCPTCGRTSIDVPGIARRVQDALANETASLTVAVMGCVVNGPGEAREADVALCGGKGCGALYIRGEFSRRVEGDLAQALIDAAREMIHEPQRRQSCPTG